MILTFEARIESDFIPRKLAVYTWEFLSIIWKAFFSNANVHMHTRKHCATCSLVFRGSLTIKKENVVQIILLDIKN